MAIFVASLDPAAAADCWTAEGKHEVAAAFIIVLQRTQLARWPDTIDLEFTNWKATRRWMENKVQPVNREAQKLDIADAVLWKKETDIPRVRELRRKASPGMELKLPSLSDWLKHIYNAIKWNTHNSL